MRKNTSQVYTGNKLIAQGGWKLKNGSGGKLLKAEWGLLVRGRLNSSKGGKYISLHTQYWCCLIAVTFQVEWSFSTFQQGISKLFAYGILLDFALP